MRSFNSLSKLLSKSSLNKISSSSTTRFYSSEKPSGFGSLISGVPKEQMSRTVRIYKPTKVVTQQGISNTLKWKLEWKKQSVHGEFWHDPLMGWNASNDPLLTTYVFFNSKEDAIDYCKRHGYIYEIEDPEDSKNLEDLGGKSYSDKFKYRKEEEEW
ncbi:NADH:ubiquinone oxidoreductase [Naegleria gruberi]|uniref:NADH dehydrogenase [ubiquinone] iron-sulfur protein 4, mitochondrial n=1 Tax=Naegleria gruberi TaxID=5762 RepID=D2VHM0_NAEGR|nr:NADH:ubiquinone oxidoreductase [Naegleria gruberi]EFC43704.1 NADH:ubiquinone oxidoreductase [Naegleria gruberi]|eukprot:XP_002676448.1 NADH:ubiquinone oxidoreductase [Naegleria gruberi strain NEG-M]